MSKNIFVGVSTASARLDNYVGCDTHGWGFLANRAVWHGKSKLRTYGDLFCTGDVLTVSLDIDEGGWVDIIIIITKKRFKFFNLLRVFIRFVILIWYDLFLFFHRS